MRQKIQQLQAEYETGQQQMALLDQRRQEIRDTLLRISGAIQVLEEMLVHNQPDNHEPEPSESSVEKRVGTG